MDAKEELKRYKLLIDSELEEYFRRKESEYAEISEFALEFVRDLAEFTLRGGKRLRPTLIYHTYRLFGGENEKEIIKISAFIELIQSFLLIHDDIMDRAELRRGKSTVHKIYEVYSSSHAFNDDQHFGATMAILSGDLANQFALEIIADSEFSAMIKDRLLKLVSTEVSKVIFGQIQDILLTYPNGYDEDDVLKVHWYKTATYTYRLPMFAGAILAGQANGSLDPLEKYAMDSGVAFQIRDDILGVFGKSDETGKEVKGDLIEGKKTLLVTESYKNANQTQKQQLDSLIGKRDLSDKEADVIREIFQKTGSLKYSEEQCAKYIDSAKSALANLNNGNGSYDFLISLADYMLVRNY